MKNEISELGLDDRIQIEFTIDKVRILIFSQIKAYDYFLSH